MAQKIKKQRSLFNRFYIGVIVSIFIMVFLAKVFFDDAYSRANSSQETINPLSKSTSTYISLIPSPTPTPLPTVTPTPTPLSGYCLYVPVLFYHHIQPQAQAVEKKQTNLSVDNGIFDRQMAYLVSRGYTSITVKQLVDALRAHSGFPGRSIAITFDDGYKDEFDYAYPVLQKYHIVGNFMIATGLLGGSDYMNWDQLSQMKGSGLVYFTDHTWSHFGLGKGDSAKIKFEVETAKQQLESHLGQVIDVFTYPYGSYSSLAISILQQDGFTGAFTTNPGSYQCEHSLMTLPRIRIGNAPLSSYGL